MTRLYSEADDMRFGGMTKLEIARHLWQNRPFIKSNTRKTRTGSERFSERLLCGPIHLRTDRD